MNHGSVTHRRFTSPLDKGEVVVPASRRPAKKRAAPLPGTKQLNLPAATPENRSVARRTLVHYQHDEKARVLGWGAFTAVCAMGLALLAVLVASPWMADAVEAALYVVAVGGFSLANLLGLLSQIFSHGRCTLGGWAIGLAWISPLAFFLLVALLGFFGSLFF